jgi:hypothetical protein
MRKLLKLTKGEFVQLSRMGEFHKARKSFHVAVVAQIALDGGYALLRMTLRIWRLTTTGAYARRSRARHCFRENQVELWRRVS